LLKSLTTKVGVALDSIGRSFLTTLNYRVYGLLALVALGLFCVWRKRRYKSYPTHQDCIAFVISLGGMIGGITVMVVFLLTQPPAIDMLSGQTLGLVGVLVPIILFGKAYPPLKALLFPPEAPKPPKD
jgi:heme A synthase